jgi:hypothetical protein
MREAKDRIVTVTKRQRASNATEVVYAPTEDRNV